MQFTEQIALYVVAKTFLGNKKLNKKNQKTQTYQCNLSLH